HSLRERSIRDLAGLFSQAVWDENAQGIKVTLTAAGPGGPLLTELGKEVIRQSGPKPKIGFSADVLFTAKGKTVEKIIRVFSVDLVYNPARGGAFVRALNPPEDAPEQQEIVQNHSHRKERETMELENVFVTQSAAADEPRQSVRTHMKADAETPEQSGPEGARQAHEAVCGYLLDSALAASRLPLAMQKHVRGGFTGRVFDPAQLQQAIAEARSLVSDLTGPAAVQGAPGAETGSMQGMFTAREQLQAAADDLLGAPRETRAAGLKVHKLQGIRELYMLLTGDYDLYGGYYPERAQMAGTADFSGLVANVMNKVIVNTWEMLGRAGYDWWKEIVTVEHFNTLNTITGTLVGTVGSLPAVAEGAAYTELEIGDSPETGTFLKYGGYIPLTLELIDRDETRKLAAYPRELASAGLRKISQLVSEIFTANAGAGPVMADTGALFNNAPAALPGGHANLLTGALSAPAWDAACQAVYDQPMLIKNAPGLFGSGPRMAINPRYLLVPRALQLTAMKILYPSLENAANIFSENMQRGQPGDVKVVPEWTDPTNWAAVCDPLIAPAVYVGERFGLMPEVFIAGDNLSPAVFTNDEHRLKVRHFLAVWVNDFRPLHKTNVADE
ncbi:MAG: hypothetical protein AAGU05_05885, partial [Anaerolineaceae bacterium]